MQASTRVIRTGGLNRVSEANSQKQPPSCSLRCKVVRWRGAGGDRGLGESRRPSQLGGRMGEGPPGSVPHPGAQDGPAPPALPQPAARARSAHPLGAPRQVTRGRGGAAPARYLPGRPRLGGPADRKGRGCLVHLEEGGGVPELWSGGLDPDRERGGLPAGTRPAAGPGASGW